VVKTSRHGGEHHSFLMIPLLACLVGWCIGYVDTRPHWDDAGMTAGALFLAGLVFGALRPPVFWVSGLALGVPVLILNVAIHGNYGSAIAVVVAVIGAGCGALALKSWRSTPR
jgi:hypothetical protein